MKHLKKLGLTATAAMALMALAGTGMASATTIATAGVAQNKSTAITATVKAGTSVILKDTGGFALNTCTGSTMAWNTASPYTGATVTGAMSALSFSPCTHPVTVHKGGTIHISYINQTTSGTVTLSGTEVTVYSTPHGTYLNCKTGAGTHLGTLSGVSSHAAHATLTLNAVLSCSGISYKWEGTYTITSPTGLGVEA
jgi:hypothetical protein